MPNLITPAEYSRRRGCSREAVSQAIEAGRISTLPGPTGRKMIDPEVADIQWKRNTDPKQAERANSGKRGDAPSGGGDQGGKEYWESKARREKAEATMAELRAEELARQLVSVERVRAASMRMSRMLRDSLLAIPSKLAPILATESDSHTIEQTLAEALRRALNDIAGMTANDLEQMAE